MLVYVRESLVWLLVYVVVGVSRENVRLLELVEQLVNIANVINAADCSVVVERNVYADYYGHILWYNCEVLLQPLVLRIEEASSLASHRSLRVVDDIAHTDNVNIATVEREVDRAVNHLECTLSLDVVGTAILVAIYRTVRVVVVGIVVTHNLIYRQLHLVVVHCIAHLLSE